MPDVLITFAIIFGFILFVLLRFYLGSEAINHLMLLFDPDGREELNEEIKAFIEQKFNHKNGKNRK